MLQCYLTDPERYLLTGVDVFGNGCRRSSPEAITEVERERALNQLLISCHCPWLEGAGAGLDLYGLHRPDGIQCKMVGLTWPLGFLFSTFQTNACQILVCLGEKTVMALSLLRNHSMADLGPC